MIQPIMKDPIFLSRKSTPAGITDFAAMKDLEDTFAAHRDGCVGMAANMIGVAKRIIIVDCGGAPLLMLNPEIVKKFSPYETEEGCLSLSGQRKVKRWRRITLRYSDKSFSPQEREFTGFTAEIIQHEVDHCDGILI